MRGTAWGYIESFLFWLLQDLGASGSLMGITITVAGIAGIPLLVLSGPIIDRIGHANVLFIGFIFYAIRLLARPNNAAECTKRCEVQAAGRTANMTSPQWWGLGHHPSWTSSNVPVVFNHRARETDVCIGYLQGWAESPRHELACDGGPEMVWSLWGSKLNHRRVMALAAWWGPGVWVQAPGVRGLWTSASPFMW
uniref:Major facilitator superfamily associated domain-containing protein n=1 Tax=Timema douglasi TaxID=61478 RepID=A0A7R8VR97_TIMDO|nr:unnamed protein product [Timema douglasi]